MKSSLVSPSAIPFVETADSFLRKTPEAARLRRKLASRPGLIGIKRGMVPYFTEKGEKFGCTVLEIDHVQVTHVKTIERDGYLAVQLGAGYKVKNQTKPMLGHFAKSGVPPKEKVYEFQVKEESELPPVGTQLSADQFKPGELVDLCSVSKGKGFAGVMKRWNFHGLKATHGVSLAHRSAGSTGQNQTPGRVLPGKKMAGRMGGQNVTTQNVEVMDVNGEKGYILVKGPVSGANGTFVRIQDAIQLYN